MKVDIERGTHEIGTFRKTTFHKAKYTITMLPEEREALAQLGIGNRRLFAWEDALQKRTREISADFFCNKKDKPESLELFALDSAELAEYENIFQESLKTLKEHIDDHLNGGKDTKESFEL